MPDEMEGLDMAGRMRVHHFNELIRHARILRFEDDVEHWESEKASFIASRRASAENGSHDA